jgi:hypothetical protein
MFDKKNRVIVLTEGYTQQEKLDWCCDHLAGTVMCHPITYGLDDAELWYFNTAEDATMFALRFA